MAPTLMELASSFAANMPPVHPFTAVAKKSKQDRIAVARVLMRAVAGSDAEALEMCRQITGPTARDVAVCAGDLLSKNPASGTGASTLAKAAMLQILVPFMNRRQLGECGIIIGQKAYEAARSRQESGTILQIEASSGRKVHASSEAIAAQMLLPTTHGWGGFVGGMGRGGGSLCIAYI